MTRSHPGFRLFFLGAGFSKPAGLPLANELFNLVREYIARRHGHDSGFSSDLAHYIEYRQKCDGINLDADSVDLEEFMAYLDLEHFLGMEGSKTLSSEGNGTQLVLRWAIGAVISQMTPETHKIPDVYKRFAEGLSTNDVVMTLNYDILLERAMESVGKSYRLFPERLKWAGNNYGEVDSSAEEVKICKLHGSIDWFDKRSFDQSVDSCEGATAVPHRMYPVFGKPDLYGTHRIIEGPWIQGDEFSRLHRIADVSRFYGGQMGWNTPFILSPSHVKFVYASPLMSLWSGWGRSGGYNLGLNIIGFSMPSHDAYFRILLYKMVSNYYSWWDDQFLDTYKDNIKIVDFRKSRAEHKELHSRFGFIDSTKLEYFLDGFNDRAVEFLFNPTR